MLTIHIASHGATGPPWDLPVPTAEQGVSWESSFYSHHLYCSQLTAVDLFNPKLSSHKYTSLWQETCFSYTSSLLLQKPFPAARAPCTSPQIFQACNKIYCRMKTLKLPAKAQEAPRAVGQALGAAVPPDLPGYHQRFYYYYSFFT